MNMGAQIAVNAKAFALRPVRMNVRKNAFINYEGTTFPRNPYEGCSMTVRRLYAFGFIADDSDLILDVLDYIAMPRPTPRSARHV